MIATIEEITLKTANRLAQSSPLSKIKIERNVPITPKSKWRELYNRMAFGDSVVLSKKARDAFQNASYRQGFPIISRRQGDGSFRCWKIKKKRRE